MLLVALFLNPIVLTIHTDRVLNRFTADVALGAGIDGHESGSLDQTFRPHNIAEMNAAELKPLSLRLRTELAIEAWHWNAKGTWSDPIHHRGYFVGDPNPDPPNKTARFTYGYRLPRRGDTIDQANNDGYSRLDDGDLSTYWKSNPYLDQHFTSEPNDRYSQWVLIDLETPKPLSAMRIDWAAPYATKYRLEYWTGKDATFINNEPDSNWAPLTSDLIGHGGVETRRFAPRSARFVRILLLASSNTSSQPSSDVRDRLGFAIKEISLPGGTNDFIRRGHTKATQTKMFVSSTDPWHRATDLDKNTEEPGFDTLARSGLDHGLPVLLPVPVLYDNPENAANEISWLNHRHVKMRGVEMGEEPDGQYVTPEHYSQLYEQVARKIRGFDPYARLGGPCYQMADSQVMAWPDSMGRRVWSTRFLAHVRQAGADFQFFSFEWYPWDDTHANPYGQLVKTPALLRRFMARERAAGTPTNIPWLMTEYGYSAFSGEAEVDLPGGILNADSVATFLEEGGNAAYLYGYEPDQLIAETPGAWGNLMMLLADDDGNAKWRLPTFWVARMMSHVWAASGSVEVLSATGGNQDIGAYPVRRPDGSIAVLIVNRNPKLAAHLQVAGYDRGRLWAYGPQQYRWQANGENGRPVRCMPPAVVWVDAGRGFSIQPSSVNVLVMG